MPLAKHTLCMIFGLQGCQFIISTRESGLGTGPKAGDSHFLSWVWRSRESPLHRENKACSYWLLVPGVLHAHISWPNITCPSSQARHNIIKLWALKSDRPGFKFQLCDSLAVCPWASHFTSLNLSSFLCDMGYIFNSVIRFEGDITQEAAQCLASGKHWMNISQYYYSRQQQEHPASTQQPSLSLVRVSLWAFTICSYYYFICLGIL